VTGKKVPPVPGSRERRKHKAELEVYAGGKHAGLRTVIDPCRNHVYQKEKRIRTKQVIKGQGAGGKRELYAEQG